MKSINKIWLSPWGPPAITGLLCLIFYAITLQTHINGSDHAYVTDVGELQNALPRWGTIHFSGYPFYSITGSLLVTLFRLVGIPPAMGASLVSAIWGALTAVLLTLTARELGASRLSALLGAIAFALSKSMWVDASIAELHTMSMLFIMAILYFAIRFDRSGSKQDLFWLTFVFSQGIFHGRAVMGVIPAVFLLVLPRWRKIWHHVLPLIGISLIAPLLYLYLPLREWMGATWTFGNTSTWDGFWRAFFNIKAGRFADESITYSWQERIRITLKILGDDMPLLLTGFGLGGLFAVKKKQLDYWRYAAALLLIWLPYAVVPLLIYGGFIGDAILAVKLPVPMFAGLGMALLLTKLQDWRPAWGRVALGLTAVAIIFMGWRNYPTVIEITKDRGVEPIIAVADQMANPEKPTVMMMLWGHNFWGVAYAQAYRGQLAGVSLVDHNAPFADYLAEGIQLVTPSETFYQRSLGWWEDILGPVYLSSTAPGVVKIDTQPLIANVSPTTVQLDLGNGILIQQANLSWVNETDVVLTVDWQAQTEALPDYSIAVHLVSQDPPTGPQDILAQADRTHPVDGWYPTSRWQVGETVRDHFRLTVPDNTQPVVVRVGMYQVVAGEFLNSAWLSLPVP